MGGGRLPAVLRAESREVYGEWLDWASKQVRRKKPNAAVVIRIGNSVGRYGLGTTPTETDTQARDVPRGRLTDAEVREFLRKELVSE